MSGNKELETTLRYTLLCGSTQNTDLVIRVDIVFCFRYTFMFDKKLRKKNPILQLLLLFLLDNYFKNCEKTVNTILMKNSRSKCKQIGDFKANFWLITRVELILRICIEKTFPKNFFSTHFQYICLLSKRWFYFVPHTRTSETQILKGFPFLLSFDEQLKIQNMKILMNEGSLDFSRFCPSNFRG